MSKEIEIKQCRIAKKGDFLYIEYHGNRRDMYSQLYFGNGNQTLKDFPDEKILIKISNINHIQEVSKSEEINNSDYDYGFPYSINLTHEPDLFHELLFTSKRDCHQMFDFILKIIS